MTDGERGDRPTSDGDSGADPNVERRARQPERSDSERRNRLERAEARRRDRRTRAAAANRHEGGNEQDGPAASGLGTLSTILRFTSLVFLSVGFVGLAVSEAWLAPAESPYAFVFGAGIVCAIVSIYLGIYRHGAP